MVDSKEVKTVQKSKETGPGTVCHWKSYTLEDF